MALINCSECGKEISDKAASCPNCGNPINKTSASNIAKQTTSTKDSVENLLHCPKCNSTQLSTNKKGFSGGKALAGAVLTGGIGFLAGTIGSSKVVITCLKCGHKYKAGDYWKEKREFERKKTQRKTQYDDYKKKVDKVAKGEKSIFFLINPPLFILVCLFIFSILIYSSNKYDLHSIGWVFIGIFILISLGVIISFISDVNKRKSKNK